MAGPRQHRGHQVGNWDDMWAISRPPIQPNTTTIKEYPVIKSTTHPGVNMKRLKETSLLGMTHMTSLRDAAESSTFSAWGTVPLGWGSILDTIVLNGEHLAYRPDSLIGNDKFFPDVDARVVMDAGLNNDSALTVQVSNGAVSYMSLYLTELTRDLLMSQINTATEHDTCLIPLDQVYVVANDSQMIHPVMDR